MVRGKASASHIVAQYGPVRGEKKKIMIQLDIDQERVQKILMKLLRLAITGHELETQTKYTVLMFVFMQDT